MLNVLEWVLKSTGALQLGVKDKKGKNQNETQQKKGPAQTTITCRGLRNTTDSTPSLKKRGGGVPLGPCVLAHAPKWTPNVAGEGKMTATLKA